MRRWLMVGAISFAAFALAASCAAGGTDDDDPCPVGSEGCACTQGGSCDGELVCLSDLCVDPTPDTDGGGGSNPSSGGNGTGNGGEGSGAFNVGGGGGGACVPEGCQKVDVLFALDGSGSMDAEINALSATQAFAGIISTLEDLNCGGIDYRIGVVDDNDVAFITPNGWTGEVPWFDSQTMTEDEIGAAFASVAQLINSGAAGTETPVGCEHVLTNSLTVLEGDGSGFLRDDALLVLILVTDVDDYGAYDQVGGHSCPRFGGCETPGQSSQLLYGRAMALKEDNPDALGAVVIGGDPGVNGGVNFCNQPGTCCSGGFDCDVFHATKLWEFVGLLNADTGANGLTANLCNGPQTVPGSVSVAFTDNIDIACQEFEPPR